MEDTVSQYILNKNFLRKIEV